MGIFDTIRQKLSNEFIDIIEWLDNTNDTIAYRFERYQNEIKNDAKLIVREGQTAVFISEGKLADVFTPGTYTLNTQNLPILSTLQGWKYGFNSPFKAEVYFVNTRLFTEEKWGTKNPIMLNDERYGFTEIRAFGSYSFRILDAGKFIIDVVGTNANFINTEINEHLRSLIVTRFTNTVGKANLPLELYAANTTELSNTCREVMQPEFARIGIELEKFFIENISLPDELKKEIFEYSRLNKIDLQKLTQFKTAQAIEEAAKQEGGAAGTGLGVGMGFTMAQQMANSLNPAQRSSDATPPPMPVEAQYYYSLNGQQMGPVSLNQLRDLYLNKSIGNDSLVWKQGMSAWAVLHTIEELKSFSTSSTPPPLPNP
ncbi:SPFH domain-containing protein [Pedobacter sp. MW01-1-1]|uniref:SPFH domain-containing protein n=1 Tax=Pedobacter sp. MW01-1-1 TaxID=3383027 RepID=UPI003FF15132